MPSYVQIRSISTSVVFAGKHNFRKFVLPERGTQIFKDRQKTNPDRSLLYRFRPKEAGYYEGDTFIPVPEMLPELVVPDLTDFKLKPYVSYRVTDLIQTEFTPEDLFHIVYAKKIAEDMKNGKLNENGSSKEPSREEQMTAEEAWTKARQTGSDIFAQRSKREEEELYDPDYLPHTSYT